MRIHFKGQVDPPVGTRMGPSMDGRYYTVAGTIYNRATNVSEVWLDTVDDG